LFATVKQRRNVVELSLAEKQQIKFVLIILIEILNLLNWEYPYKHIILFDIK